MSERRDPWWVSYYRQSGVAQAALIFGVANGIYYRPSLFLTALRKRKQSTILLWRVWLWRCLA
jgi:hypothetical protein